MNSLNLIPVRTPHFGPDVSRYDNRRPDPNRSYDPNAYVNDVPIDWVAMKAAGMVDVALICMSLGIYDAGGNWKVKVDPGFELSWKGARAAGLPRIAWPVIFPEQNAISTASAILEYMDECGFDRGTDRLALDFEQDNGVGPLERMIHLGSLVYELGKGGVIPFIYTNFSFMNDSTTAWIDDGRDIAWLKKYPLWLAWPPADPQDGSLAPDAFATLKNNVATGTQKPYNGSWIIPTPWDLEDLYNRGIWQFTWCLDTKKLPGHPGIKLQVDYNVIYYEIPVITHEAGVGKTQPANPTEEETPAGTQPDKTAENNRPQNSWDLTPVRTPHFGPDVSRYDNRRPDPNRPDDPEAYLNDVPIDWSAMKAAGVADVALICMSLGIHNAGDKWKVTLDPGFELSWKGARAAGLPRIAWPVIFPGQSAILTAAAILDYLGECGFDFQIDRLALDFERDDDVGPMGRLLHLKTLVDELGKKDIVPFIYTNFDFMDESTRTWKDSGRDITWLKKCPLWLAWPPAEPKSGTLTDEQFKSLHDSVGDGRIKPHSDPSPRFPEGKWNVPEPWDLKDLYDRGIWQYTWRVDPRQLPGHPGFKLQVDYNVLYYEIPSLAHEAGEGKTPSVESAGETPIGETPAGNATEGKKGGKKRGPSHPSTNPK